MKRLVIHAGFAKAGSSSIQVALEQQSVALASCGIAKLGEDFRRGSPGTPQWFINDAAKKGLVLTDLLKAELDQGEVSVLSAENLQYANMPRLLAGIDALASVTVLFYMRPQANYIASAWKQWSMKDGTGLSAYAHQCIEQGAPPYVAMIRAWREALPQADIRIIPFVSAYLHGGSIARDFFIRIGANVDPGDIWENTSLDFALQHVLWRNAPAMFKDHNDTGAENWLWQNVQDKRYLVNRTPMLSAELCRAIFERFREENVDLLREFSDIPNPRGFVDCYFPQLPAVGQSYLEMPEEQILARAREMLDEEGRRKFGLDGAAELGQDGNRPLSASWRRGLRGLVARRRSGGAKRSRGELDRPR